MSQTSVKKWQNNEKSEKMSPTSVKKMTNYNHGHNIMRIFDVLPNFPFTASGTKSDY